MRYYLILEEDGHLMPVGASIGYATFDEAKAQALRRVDDACPRNTVWVLTRVAVAGLSGDGEPYIRMEGQGG